MVQRCIFEPFCISYLVSQSEQSKGMLVRPIGLQVTPARSFHFTGLNLEGVSVRVRNPIWLAYTLFPTCSFVVNHLYFVLTSMSVKRNIEKEQKMLKFHWKMSFRERVQARYWKKKLGSSLACAISAERAAWRSSRFFTPLSDIFPLFEVGLLFSSFVCSQFLLLWYFRPVAIFYFSPPHPSLLSFYQIILRYGGLLRTI